MLISEIYGGVPGKLINELNMNPELNKNPYMGKIEFQLYKAMLKSEFSEGVPENLIKNSR